MKKSLSRVLALGVFAVLALSNAASSPAARAQSANANAQVIKVTAKKYEFNPSTIRVKQGATVQLEITALDHNHGFKISEYPDGAPTSGTRGLAFTDYQECRKIHKGETLTLEFTANTAGTYSFACCDFCGFGHKHMKGQIVVEP